MDAHRTLSHCRAAVLLLLAASLLTGSACAQVRGEQTGAAPEEAMAENASWKEVERLISEAKLEAAAEIAEKLRVAAEEEGDEEAYTRALVKETQLRIALHGYATAVSALRETPWPDGAVNRAVLRLFYAHALVTYLQSYSWEIEQRERVESAGEVDLEAWTKDQIYAEAQAAYLDVWNAREAWGSESLGRVAEFIEQNTYPARIRGTLRDAVSYLYAELLANSSLWRPEESNELYRLDLEALLGDAPPDVALDDADAHPLLKLTRVLADLEAWHRGRDRPEAAFAARLERLERLHSAFTRGDDKRAIESALEDALEDLGRRYEWWSYGRATLAEWVRERGDLVTARKIALEAAEAHPDSAGGKRARHVAAAIEMPSFQLEGMATDSPDRRSLLVHHQNLETLHFRAYALDLLEQVTTAKDYNLLPAQREVPRIVAERKPVASWSVDLPPTPDFERHRTYVTPPLEGPGLYLIVASMRRDFDEPDNQRAAVNLILGDLAILTRTVDRALEATVRSASGGGTLAGVEVDVYRYDFRNGHRRVATKMTGNDGVARFDAGTLGRHSHFLVARRGEDAVLQPGIQRLYDREPERQRAATLLYTDRSVYRPGQEVLWKAVAYRGSAERARYETWPGAELTVELRDANGEVVASAEVETNDFGSAAGRFQIPTGRLLGSWTLRSSVDGFAQIRVEEYKRPTFVVEISDPPAPLKLNRQAALTGDARYYFGLPVTSGEVAWRVTREPVYPFWGWWYWPPEPASPRVIAAGTAELDADGRFELAFTPEADPRDADAGVSYRYRLAVDVTDDGGETRSGERVFALGFVSVTARLEAERGFYRAGEPIAVEVSRRDLDGTPRPGEGTWRLVRLDQPEETLLPAEQPLPEPPPAVRDGDGDGDDYETPGDRLRPRWAPEYAPERVMRLWPEGERVDGGTLAPGDAKIELDGLAAGVYRLKYETADPEGGKAEAVAEIVVAADGETPLALPAVLLAERDSVAVGEVARFLVHSGLPDQDLVLELYRGQERIERRRFDSDAGARVFEIPITPKHRGGFGARLVALRDHQLMDLQTGVFVPWDDRRLELEFTSFRDLLRPGARERFRVVVKGADEEALERGAAEVLGYMFDKSLELFARHEPPDPLHLYPDRRGTGDLASSLGVAHQVWNTRQGFNLPSYPHFQPDRLKFYDSYGIGGPGVRLQRMRKGMPMVAMESRLPASPARMEMAADMAAQEESVMVEGRGGDPQEPEPPAPPEGDGLRTDFAETAFWEPQLRLDADGAVAFEFTVPDSVTEWSVWVHALTTDLRAGSLERQTRTVKDLLVRPYLPRFFREGDRVELKVVVQNASERELTGTLDFEILDPETEADLGAAFALETAAAEAVPFTVAPGGSTDLVFAVRVPHRVGPVAVRVLGRAGDWSDGELRPLAVLPGRLHLAQSRFAVLHDRDARRLHFEDLEADDDPTRIDEELVVTLDAQLFYSVLEALPYLVEYPYECVEQLLNRFVSTGILSTLYDDYPAVAEMAKKLSTRDTRLEVWEGDDPNRRMVLEESPWLRASRGGPGDEEEDLVKVLDPEIARATRKASIAKLAEAQTSLGGFPWWPGGPPSPYMTLYLLDGFSRALEFGVEVPRDMVQRGWSYMHRHYLDRMVRDMTEGECCWELVTYLNYILSNYPDESWTGGVFTTDERARMLEFSFRHWREHSPRLKGYLALTLGRAGRRDDAELVWDSVMDSAKTDRDLGTYWAPEERAWLWYNDTIETHALALRVLMALDPDDERRHGLVQWLLLNKKLNHWKSTRATAEVIYSLVHYLEREGALGVSEAATVAVGARRETFTFEPDEFTGKSVHMVIPGEEVGPETATVEVEKETKGFLFASATWHFSTEQLPDEARGDFFRVERRYFRRVQAGSEWVLRPLEEGARLEPGDQIEVQLSLRAGHAAEYVHLRDPRGAGFEPENVTSRYRWDLGIGWYEEIRDSGTNFFFDWLPAGEYTFKYRLRASHAGTFRVGPAVVQSMYAPEFVGYSTGAELEIEPDGS